MSIVLVTGAAGFIGREVVHQLFGLDHYVVAVDRETYASRPDLLRPYRDRMRYIRADVRDLDNLFDADCVMHLAAESHVDNSITNGRAFIETNVGGTFHLLELIRAARPHNRPLLVHVSTDEVYGDVPDEWASKENDPLIPSSPYSATKAAADMLVMAWARTYDIRARIVRPSNCYGEGQHPEKLIPKIIRAAVLGRAMTIHGDGTQTRSWLHVEDCARALIAVWKQGMDGEIYNIPGNAEISVRAVVERVQRLYRDQSMVKPQEPKYGCERPGGDRRYRVDGSLLARLGWEPKGNFAQDLERIVRAEIDAGVVL